MTDLRPYAVLVFSAALHPARDKVPRRTDFPLRRAPPYFLSTGQENVREPHSPWLFFAQMVKRHACGFFFVLFLSAKKKDKGFLPFPKGGMVFFSCSPGKRTKRMRDRSGRSDLCEGFAFTRCSRHVFAQASLCKPRRNTQRDNKVHLLFFAPAGTGEFCGLCLCAGAACSWKLHACGREEGAQVVLTCGRRGAFLYQAFSNRIHDIRQQKNFGLTPFSLGIPNGIPCAAFFLAVPHSKNKVGFIYHIPITLLLTAGEVARRNERLFVAVRQHIVILLPIASGPSPRLLRIRHRRLQCDI